MVCFCVYEGEYLNDGPWICNRVSSSEFLPSGYYPGIDCKKGVLAKRDKCYAARCKYFEPLQVSLFER